MQTLSKTLHLALQSNLVLCFVGDIMQHDAQLREAKSANGMYNKTFQQVKDKIFSNCHYVIGNLETVISENPTSGFPKFNATKDLLTSLRWSGVSHLTVANNHSLDQGDEGFQQTVNNSLAAGFVTIGSSDRPTCEITRNDVKVTIWSGTKIMNDDKESALVNFYNRDNISLGKGINIAFIHDGTEYDKSASDSQIDTTNELLQLGFDAIIFCHSHVIGQHQIHKSLRKRAFVCYGLGNLLSDQEMLDRQLGQALTIEISKRGIESIVSTVTETVWDGSDNLIEVLASTKIL